MICWVKVDDMMMSDALRFQNLRSPMMLSGSVKYSSVNCNVVVC